jgi:hypothetical protein
VDVDPLLHRRDLGVYAPDVEERLRVAPPEHGREALAERRQARDASAHFADADERLGHGAVERLGEVVRGADDGVDEIHLRRQPLEEEVAARRVRVRVDVKLGEVRLSGKMRLTHVQGQ